MFNFRKYNILVTLLLSLLLLSSCYNWNQNVASPILTTPTPVPTNNNNNDSSITTSQINISIKDFLFNPWEVTIKVWSTITWTNEDSMHHTVTADGKFDSWELNKGETFSYTFNDVGTYDYICTYHPSMKGKIIVEN